MPDNPTVTVTLEPGEYLIDICKYPVPHARVWKHQGNGVFVGHGGKIRKAEIAYALNTLIAAAEREEGIRE